MVLHLLVDNIINLMEECQVVEDHIHHQEDIQEQHHILLSLRWVILQ